MNYPKLLMYLFMISMLSNSSYSENVSDEDKLPNSIVSPGKDYGDISETVLGTGKLLSERNKAELQIKDIEYDILVEILKTDHLKMVLTSKGKESSINLTENKISQFDSNNNKINDTHIWYKTVSRGKINLFFYYEGENKKTSRTKEEVVEEEIIEEPQVISEMVITTNEQGENISKLTLRKNPAYEEEYKESKTLEFIKKIFSPINLFSFGLFIVIIISILIVLK